MNGRGDFGSVRIATVDNLEGERVGREDDDDFVSAFLGVFGERDADVVGNGLGSVWVLSLWFLLSMYEIDR